MSSAKTIHIVVFGIGNVGSTLIRQINEANSFLWEQHHLRVTVPIIANSKYALYKDELFSNDWVSDFDRFSVPYDINEIIQFTKEKAYENLIAIDATASDEFVTNYVKLVQNGFHIISANKVANTESIEFYESLRQALEKHGKSFLYETNVGAGLPIIETVQSLYQSGEKIQKVRGVFSGSLSYIFNTFSSNDVRFSEVLKEASKLGFTEPDPRVDLSGKDVARKLLILARELQLKTELRDIKVHSLVPKQLNGKTSVRQFNERISELDQPFEVVKRNLKNNSVLRYVGELDVDAKSLEVKLVSEEKSTALGQLKNADSIFEIYTESYGNTPLVIQGAGAGREVTARGVFSDIVKLSKQLK